MERARGDMRRGTAQGRPAILFFGWSAVGALALAFAGLAAAPPNAHGEVKPAASFVARRPASRVEPGPPPEASLEDLAAASAILVEAESGEVLYSRAARERRAPASLTKVMSAVIVLERAGPADQVVVSPRAPEAGGHSMGLRPGQRLSVADLLAALMIRSANDAAVALAEHVGRSVAGFAALMNAKARALGMADTHFENPHGLDAPEHYSTAYDLAILTRYAFQSPAFAELVRARQKVITVSTPGSGKRRGRLVARQRVLRTHNRLLDAFEGADGVKTGFTGEAGRCLVASAQRGGRRLIAVLLNDLRRWDDAATLLEYGFTIRNGSGEPRDVGPPGLAPPRHFAPDEPQVGG